ncbi:MAG: beta-ketoacyl-ACP synthase II [Thermodesulfovibrionales bacterium]
MNRVVVTGIGAVSPLGNTFQESWAAAKKGLAGIGPVTGFDASDIPWQVAGELKHFDPGRYLSGKELKRLDPFAQYAVAAAVMAAEDAGLISSFILHPSSLSSAGIIVGSSRGGISSLEHSIIKSRRLSRKQHSVSPYLMPATTISMAPSYIAQKLGIKGCCLGVSNACASGANAIGEAYRLIISGYKYPVLCGGAEAPLCGICFQGYGASGALSKINDSTASRPFDRTRDGFVLSEGACIMVLEEYTTARKRGAKVYGEITGYGNTCDSFHQTIPSAEGEARAISAAIEDAGLAAGDIDFINAHGTSTILGDKTETEAIKITFGKKACEIPVFSLKSMTGHMLAASGALEAAITMISMCEGTIPPTINLTERDPKCDLDIVTELRKADIEYAISNSFGFGGVNAVLVMKKI